MLLRALKEANNELLEMGMPNVFNPMSDESVIIGSEISNEQTYLALEEQGLHNARTLTVFQFEAYIKKNQDEIKRLNKNAKVK